MKTILVILASIWAVFGATYTVTPIQSNATVNDIGYTVNDSTWQLQTVVDNYHIGGATYGKTYWGSTRNVTTGNGEVRYYYWCGGATTWCYKTVHTYTNASANASIWNVNGIIYAYVPHSASTDLKVNYTDTLWYDTTYDRISSQPIATKDGIFCNMGADSIWRYDIAGNLTYQMRGQKTRTDYQHNAWSMSYNVFYVFKSNAFVSAKSTNFNGKWFSSEDMLFYGSPFFTNRTDTLKYTITDGERSSTNSNYYVFSGKRFYIPHSKSLFLFDWPNKKIYTYALPESATTPIYMPSSDTVYYGHGNINKIMVLESLITSIEKSKPIKPFANVYPNPFNPTTTISYEVSQTSNVKVVVYSTKGELLNTLIDARTTSGHHSVEFKGSYSGTYICKVQIGSYSKMIKMTLIK